MTTKKILSALILFWLAACGGGGGGGDGGASSGGDPNKRSTGTGLRVIHAALDVEPVDVRIGELVIPLVRFLDVTYYNSIKTGSQNVVVDRANFPGATLSSVGTDFKTKTEYSLLISGRQGTDTFFVSLLEEPVLRPETGRGRIQLINLLEGSSPMTLAGPTIPALGPIAFRLSSGYIDVASGAQTFLVADSSGNPLANISTTIADRGEITVVIGGSRSRGVVLSRIYTDLD